MSVADLSLVFYKEKGVYNNCQGKDQSNSDKRSRFWRYDTFLRVAEFPVALSRISAPNFYERFICLFPLVFNVRLIFYLILFHTGVIDTLGDGVTPNILDAVCCSLVSAIVVRLLVTPPLFGFFGAFSGLSLTLKLKKKQRKMQL